MNEPRAGQGVTAADQQAIHRVEELASRGAETGPQLLQELATQSWVVRRTVVEQLARLGEAALGLLCQSLREDRRSETQLAAVVDALAASHGAIDAQVSELLSDSNEAVICDAAQILGRRRALSAVPQLVQLTQHADDNVAVACVEALGTIGGTEALDCLVGVLRSESFFRSFPAIDVLGRLGDSRAVEPLCCLLSDGLRGHEAARALGRIGDETAIFALVRALSSGPAGVVRSVSVALMEIHRRSTLRYGSGIALERAFAHHARDSGLPSRLQRALAGADASEMSAISQLLGFFSSGHSVETLLPLLNEAPDVARAAAISCGRLARAGNVPAIELLRSLSSAQRVLVVPELAGLKAAVSALVDCLSDPQPQVRVLGCDALAKTGDPSCAGALFGLLDDPDLAVTQAAVAALQSLGSQETEQRALELAQADPPARRRAALRILAYFGYPSALRLLTGGVTDDDERVREIALSGLSNVGGPEAMSVLLRASRHDSARTRAAAVRALGTVEASPAVLERLTAASSDSDAWVRYYACQALGNAADPSSATVLSAHLEDPAGQVRVAAVDALARLSGPPAFQVLARAAEHEDLEIRRAALTGIGVARHPELLPLLFDAARAKESATRLVAVSGLAKYSDDAALVRVCELAKGDVDATVQNAAIELLSEDARALSTQTLLELLSTEGFSSRALEALGRKTTERLPQLAAALSEASAAVAEGIVAVITRLPPLKGEPVLLSALKLPNASARRAAVKALRVAFDSAAVTEELARTASSDSDPEVRRVAMARLS